MFTKRTLRGMTPTARALAASINALELETRRLKRTLAKVQADESDAMLVRADGGPVNRICGWCFKPYTDWASHQESCKPLVEATDKEAAKQRRQLDELSRLGEKVTDEDAAELLRLHVEHTGCIDGYLPVSPIDRRPSATPCSVCGPYKVPL